MTREELEAAIRVITGDSAVNMTPEAPGMILDIIESKGIPVTANLEGNVVPVKLTQESAAERAMRLLRTNTTAKDSEGEA